MLTRQRFIRAERS